MTVQQAAEFFKARGNYLILTHVRPDGDTIGCAAGLCQALRQAGKTAHILPNLSVSTLFAPYLEGLLSPADFAPDTVVSVDLAARSLFPENAQVYLERVDLAIDHHPSQEFFAKQTCLDAGRAACGEIVLDIARLLGPITPEIAVPLYVAISTDCGCFAYGNTTAATHRAAAELAEAGIPLARLNKIHFRTKTLRRMKLEGLIIEGMELYEEDTVAVAAVTREMMQTLGATARDTEDIANLVGQLEGVKTGVTIREMEGGRCKLSVRTDPADLDAGAVCALLGGGGHAAAAGAVHTGSVEDTKAAVLAAIRQVKHG